jgi:pimeloyl-ACP methyl ester carboxylesterase
VQTRRRVLFGTLGFVEVRRYGAVGPEVVLLHGGPGAIDSTIPVGEELSRTCRVFEPVQEARTVDGHIRDLEGVARALSAPLYVGWSWGAMLALAYAAEHPVRALFLVGCGTFDAAARAQLQATRLARLHGFLPRTFEEWGASTARTDDYDAFAPAPAQRCDVEAGEATWDDMIRLQAEGRYPAAFASIACPVLLVHGNYDPHPGPLVEASLAPFVRDLTYLEIPRCGHTPWIERHGREPFFKLLFDWVDKTRTIPWT